MSNALSLIGWTFLPGLATGWAQSLYYSITIRAGSPRPQPGSAKFVHHRRVIHFLVVSAYLIFTLLEAHQDLRAQGTFYSDLNLTSLDATEKEIKSRFRRLGAIHHPDKSSDPNGGDKFMALKIAAETLQNPASRFAYDRFGPEATKWQRAVTIYDYLTRGVFQNLLPHYGVAAAFLYGLSWLGYLNWGRYWRWVILTSLFVFEMHVISRPDPPYFLELLNVVVTSLGGSPYLPFQLISLARKTSITLYIAFNQLGPSLDRFFRSGDSSPEAQEEASDAEGLRKGLERLEQMARGLNVDSEKLIAMEMVPFANDPEGLGNMKGKVKDWLVQNTIRSDPMVRDAVGNSFKKRRVDAPAGAKGNR